jgi:pyrimidine-specific ribonucleoside hydrolase
LLRSALALRSQAETPVRVRSCHPRQVVRIAFDMETRDPDDALALCLLATHPAVELVAVTVTPGTAAQIGVVREILRRLAIEVPVGARDPRSSASAVSPFHFDWLGATAPSAADAEAHEVLAAVLRSEPQPVLLTGAPLQNLRLLLERHLDVRIQRWVAQGGFAGIEVTPPEHRLPKFAGLSSCETFNFNGDKRATRAALESPRLERRELVSKNVTHGIAWDAALQARLGAATGLTAGVVAMREAMSVYLRSKPEGKLLHDPLAACAAIDPGAFTWVEVEVVYAGGRWGSRSSEGTGTFITTAVDWPHALRTMVAPAVLPDEDGAHG